MSQKFITPKLTLRLHETNSIWRNVFKFRSIMKNKSILVLLLLFPTAVFAHRGIFEDSKEIDKCRIRVGYERIHFSAYTPTFTGSKTYCEAIPNLGPTNLVFDYEGKKLRNVTIEFEITKEPDGSRVFYQEPKKIKTGTVNALVDFSKYGVGNYLAHVTIVHKGKKLDQHIPFSVGFGEEFRFSFRMIFYGILVIVIILIFVIRFFKGQNNQIDIPGEKLQ